MEKVTEGLRAWIEANAARIGGQAVAELYEIADGIDVLASDECAYAITQTRNDYEDWLDPHEAEHQRREYYEHGFTEGYEAGEASA